MLLSSSICALRSRTCASRSALRSRSARANCASASARSAAYCCVAAASCRAHSLVGGCRNADATPPDLTSQRAGLVVGRRRRRLPTHAGERRLQRLALRAQLQTLLAQRGVVAVGALQLGGDAARARHFGAQLHATDGQRSQSGIERRHARLTRVASASEASRSAASASYSARASASSRRNCANALSSPPLVAVAVVAGAAGGGRCSS